MNSIHSGCAAAFARHRGKTGTLHLLQEEIFRLEKAIESVRSSGGQDEGKVTPPVPSSSLIVIISSWGNGLKRNAPFLWGCTEAVVVVMMWLADTGQQ